MGSSEVTCFVSYTGDHAGESWVLTLLHTTTLFKTASLSLYLVSRRENHCQRFVEGLPKSTRTMDFSLLLDMRVILAICVVPIIFPSRVHTRTSRFINSPIPYFLSFLNRQLLSFVCFVGGLFTHKCTSL